jgi:hypothetical protein
MTTDTQELPADVTSAYGDRWVSRTPTATSNSTWVPSIRSHRSGSDRSESHPSPVACTRRPGTGS